MRPACSDMKCNDARDGSYCCKCLPRLLCFASSPSGLCASHRFKDSINRKHMTVHRECMACSHVSARQSALQEERLAAGTGCIFICAFLFTSTDKKGKKTAVVWQYCETRLPDLHVIYMLTQNMFSRFDHTFLDLCFC